MLWEVHANMRSDSLEFLQLQDVSGEVKETEGLKVEHNDEKALDLPAEDNGKETEH